MPAERLPKKPKRKFQGEDADTKTKGGRYPQGQEWTQAIESRVTG